MKRLAAILCTIYMPALAAEPAPYVIVDAASIPEPLTVGPADPERGAAIMAAAGCSACHQKDLNRISKRMTAGEIRLMIAAPEVRVPDTVMPAYYEVGVFGVAPDDLVGRTRLSAADIEAIIAYLMTL